MSLVLLPILMPFFTALVVLLAGGRTTFGRRLTCVSAAGQLVAGMALLKRTLGDGIQVVTVGGWPAPQGIVLVADVFSALMVVLAAGTMLAGTAYGLWEMPKRLSHPLRLPLMQFLAVGIQLSFLTGDLFNLFVAFEVLLFASYALLTLEADDWDVKQAFPYLAMNAVGSTLFFCAAGLTYGLLGTLNMADMAQRASMMAGDGRLTALALMLLGVFGLKAGLFPFYYWLPHSYPTLSTPVAGVFAGLLTKVGIYVLIRLVATILPHEMTGLHSLLAWVSGATMLFGVLGAISRNYIRGILSFHIVSQVAFMTLALGLFTPLSLTAAIFYIAHHILVKGSLFLIGGVAAMLNRTDDLTRMGGLWKTVPWLGVLFLAQALSLAGVPPLSGFWGKYLILHEGLDLGEYVLVAVSLIASLLTLFSMLKIWLSAFWSAPEGVTVRRDDGRWRPLSWICAGMVGASLAIGLGAEPLFQMAKRAAAMAMDQEGYIRAVLAAPGKEGTR